MVGPRLIALAAILCVSATVRAQLPVPWPNGIGAFPPLFPMPKSYTNGSAAVVVSTALNFVPDVSSTAAAAALTDATARFSTETFMHQPMNTTMTGALTDVVITVVNSSLDLQLYVAENYTLAVPATGGNPIVIKAQTVYGAYRALQSLSQLISFDYDNQQYVIRAVPWVVDDEPRFPHRGVLVDTSRHFQPVATIKNVIDSIAMAKFNALHWHIVDAESFAYDSVTYPKLGKMTSYAPSQRFTQNDIKDVVAYGKARGIRVMVELDTPGHSASMCYAYPEMCPDPFCTSANVNNWALDITKNFTYTVVEALLTEFNGLFPEHMIHLGGDEVIYNCWEAHPSIMQWLADRDLSLNQGFEYYVKRVQDFVWNTFPQRLVMGWQEIWEHFGTSLNKRTIIQQWLPNSITLPLNVTSHGYRLVWSDSSRWYLDHLSVTWQDMYTAEPCNGLPDRNCELILGGEACMWGETVDTSDILQTIWPRAAAVAERLWSPRDVNSTINALPRMLAFRCLLNSRGVPAAPVENDVARAAPPGPGACFWQ